MARVLLTKTLGNIFGEFVVDVVIVSKRLFMSFKWYVQGAL